jgi:hypothetical protein
MKKKLLLYSAALALLIQFFPAPAKSNPSTDPTRAFSAVMKPPQPVHDILNRACLDCHSNETKWPWYANVAPISWPVRDHVIEGRKHLNFSEWLKPGETTFTSWSDLEGICKSVRDNSMPLPYYDWMHPEAKLSAGDREAVCAWVDSAIGGAGK